ncbi:MAG: metal-dependent transcriptional regulator [Anaerolineales bacterium]|nr:metal-dependent transcriptional regulator [Anaerolineales bacterium]
MSDQTNNLSQAVQDYLKAIYTLAQRHGQPVGTTQLAAHLALTPASVTGMVQKLARQAPPLLRYEKHRGVSLTAEGETAALHIIRRHRLLETLLHDTLGYGWDEVHEEAERLEHALSPALTQRIADVLGNPRHDPHGQPIPTRELQLPPRPAAMALAALPVGETAVLHHVRDEDAAVLRQLAALGLRPGTRLTLQARTAAHLILLLNGRADPILLPAALANHIFLEAYTP